MNKEKFLELYSQGLPDMDIAEEIFGNREKNSGQKVARLRKKMNLPPRKAKRGPKPDTSLDEEVRRLYEKEKKTCLEIGERLGKTENWVYRALLRIGATIDRRRGRYSVSDTIPENLAEVWASTVCERELPLGGKILQGSAHRVAEHFGVSGATALNWLKSTGLLQDRLPRLEEWRGMYEGGWHVREGVMKNREPHRHKEIVAGYKDESILQVHNAGTAVYVWRR